MLSLLSLRNLRGHPSGHRASVPTAQQASVLRAHLPHKPLGEKAGGFPKSFIQRSRGQMQNTRTTVTAHRPSPWQPAVGGWAEATAMQARGRRGPDSTLLAACSGSRRGAGCPRTSLLASLCPGCPPAASSLVPKISLQREVFPALLIALGSLVPSNLFVLAPVPTHFIQMSQLSRLYLLPRSRVT